MLHPDAVGGGTAEAFVSTTTKDLTTETAVERAKLAERRVTSAVRPLPFRGEATADPTARSGGFARLRYCLRVSVVRIAVCALGCALAAGVPGCMSDEAIIQLAHERASAKAAAPRAEGADEFARAQDSAVDSSSEGKDEGRSLHPVPPAPLQEDAPKAFSFACNYWKDVDGNGLTDYPAEFIGIGNSFSTSEKVALCLGASIARPYERTFRLLDGSGNVVFEETKRLQASPAGRISLLQFNPRYLKPGSYEAVWSIDGKDVGSTQFVIVEE